MTIGETPQQSQRTLVEDATLQSEHFFKSELDKYFCQLTSKLLEVFIASSETSTIVIVIHVTICCRKVDARNIEELIIMK
jgi:hypothetical protein